MGDCGVDILLHNKLIVGNDDSVLMLGCEEQQQLREFSKTISNQLLSTNGDLEYLLQDILNEINEFQNLIEKKQVFPLKNEKKRENLIKKYNAILVYMDKMELALKLQEAQLIKDSKLFEKVSKSIDDMVVSLQNRISYGNDIIAQKSSYQFSEDMTSWYERLSKRIDDLKISHTVAIQTKAQINLMLENNKQLIDKIMGAVSGTIPVWRNQITILLGIEKVNRNLEIQNKVAEITKDYIEIEKRRKNNKNQKELCIENLLYTNETLKKALHELEIEEKHDGDIRIEFNSSLRL